MSTLQNMLSMLVGKGAYRETLKTFVFVGPPIGAFIFGIYMFLFHLPGLLNNTFMWNPHQSIFDFLLPAYMILNAGMLLCWPLGIVPALLVAVPSAKYGVSKGHVPLWLPVGIATILSIIFDWFAGVRSQSAIIWLGSVFIVPAFVCWASSRKHWKS